jgi:hypothetical protein
MRAIGLVHKGGPVNQQLTKESRCPKHGVVIARGYISFEFVERREQKRPRIHSSS